MVSPTRPGPGQHEAARFITGELDWLEAVMAARFAAYAITTDTAADAAPPHAAPHGVPDELPAPPPLQQGHGPYAALLRELDLGPAERLLLVLALTPCLAPERLDAFLLHNTAIGRRFTEFGGLLGQSHAGFLPTAETAMFLLAGNHRARRIALAPLFRGDHPLLRRGLLSIEHRHPEEPPLAGLLRLTSAGLHQLLHGGGPGPQPGPDFPATLITTPLDWDDLVLDAATMEQIDMVGQWIAHGRTLMDDWGLARRLKPGYRCLFHGGPGTGKTLTACLLGKRHALPVYRVDLSRVVSKWIGETEKNLATLFDQAQDRQWILFFDEAEALFGKRTESRSSNDRAANQQIAYLLQRLETHAGLAILATNQSAHLDEAFARRFQAAVRFPVPDAAARTRLWRETFDSPGFTLGPDVDFKALAERYELAGGAIINVLRHAALKAVQRQPATVHARDLLEGIRLEMHKEGRHLSH